MASPPKVPLVQVMVSTEDGVETGEMESIDDFSSISATTGRYVLVGGALRSRPSPAAPSGAHNSFHYKPLNRARREIRLLNVYRGSDGVGEMRCQIRHVSLDDPPKYSALSYAWGEATDRPLSILCDWRPFNVTVNLYSALVRMRDHDDNDSRLIWVDAICINQDDNDEKDFQLNLMRDIYHKATTVHVWLGEASHDTHLVDDFARQLLRASTAKSDAGDDRLWPLMSHSSRKTYGFPPISDPGYRALARFLESPWINRIWVIQEVTVAREALFHRGSFVVPLLPIIYAFGRLSNMGISTELGFAIGGRELTMLQVECLRFLSHQASKLLALLLRHRTRVSSEAKDKVYALCNIAMDIQTGKLDLVRSYNLSTRDAYIRTAKAIITADENLNILSAILISTAPTTNGAPLPSWVPDWENCQHDTMISREPEPGQVHGAYFNSNCTGVKKYVPRFDGNKLIIRAHLLDIISKCGVSFTPDEPLPPNPSWEFVADAEGKDRYPFTGESMLHVYYFTMTFGYRRGDRSEALAAFNSYHQNWRAFRQLLESNITPETPRFGASYSDKFHKVLLHPLSRDIHSSHNRKMARTTNGHVSMIPAAAEEGDYLALCEGSSMPLILREVNDTWMLIGDCYVHGVMNGEAFDGGMCRMIALE